MGGPRPAATWERLDRLFAAAITLGTASTVLLLALGVHGHALLPSLDLALDTVSLVAFAALTVLAWSRFRENRVIAAAYHAAAFVALAVAYGIAVLHTLDHGDGIGRLPEPHNVQLLVFAIARMGAATLFVIAGSFMTRRTYGSRPALILVAPALAVLVGGLVASQFDPPPGPLQILTLGDRDGLPGATPFGALIHITIAILFLAGAYAGRRLWRREHAVLDGWIAIGLVFAGFGELHWTLYPSAHPGQVSTGDVFRLAFAACLLLGLEGALRSGLRELRSANEELARLRDLEVERATLEERTRLARELHDGLAQDLWLAKLRTAELMGMTDLSDAARQAAKGAAAAIEVGLGEAREAVAALRSPGPVDAGFGDVVRRTVEDYGDRFGMRVEFSFEGESPTRIAPRTQAEALRITQEAMTNAARHADASVVGVRLLIREERFMLRIVDNGRGFDPAAVPPTAFGLVSMRERAVLLGGRLRIVSRAGDGTRVVLTAPLARPVSPPEVERT